ncbi:MAG: hypothetical protein M1823_007958, partial [Watsoniomyces obsoletus]
VGGYEWVEFAVGCDEAVGGRDADVGIVDLLIGLVDFEETGEDGYVVGLGDLDEGLDTGTGGDVFSDGEKMFATTWAPWAAAVAASLLMVLRLANLSQDAFSNWTVAILRSAMVVLGEDFELDSRIRSWEYRPFEAPSKHY